ncbi:MAG: phospholipase D-like domain-containing protein [Planctomycetota bacterium]|nr:phospholipase D-like domain-containing protein [Planctomycetota bacterium]
MGNCVSGLLNSGKYKKVKMMVAFAKQSGIGRLLPDFMSFKNSGGNLESIVGIDHRITTYQALQQLVNLSNNIFIHHDKGVNDFHPKLYIFEDHISPQAILIGSSNLTVGGLFVNYEANVLLSNQGLRDDNQFVSEVNNFYNSVAADTNTKRATHSLLSQLYTQGLIIDETRTRTFAKIVNRISQIPFSGRQRKIHIPSLPKPVRQVSITTATLFTMTLSKFDVSSKSLDPIILVPISALKQEPAFWDWPTAFSLSGGGYPERYTTANVNLPGKQSQKLHIRLYYYERKSEFRLQCEPIKRNGNPGDIVVIQKINNSQIEYDITLIPLGASNFSQYNKICQTKVSNQKCCGYQ